MLARATLLAGLLAATGCTAVVDGPGDPEDRDDPFWVEDYDHDHAEEEDPAASGAMFAPSTSVLTAATTGACSTTVVRGLAEQLVEEIECMRPGTMARIDGAPGVYLSGATFPYLQGPAADALRRAAAVQPMTINSGLRTVVQQFVLYTWYTRGRCTSVVSLAAPPGRSNHESGLAVDVAEYDAAYTPLTGRGFSWLGSGDPWHFDYVAGGVDLRSMSVMAFQRLWNRNRPTERIAEDGAWGAATEAAVARAPSGGFTSGPSCGRGVAGDVAVEVYWSRDADGTYQLRALAPAEVVRVEYRVDGFVIGGATRADGSNFPDTYRFSTETSEREFEVTGYDAAGDEIGLGVGLLDVTAGTGVYIKQMGRRLYEIGLERPPAGVAAIEVRADGWLLTDSESDATRSTRRAVRSTFSQLGERSFELRTFNADGTLRGTLRRTFTLR